MEKRSGRKECPRCGLRNKPSVAQCDFCGWQFEESQDEWIDQIKALEKIGTGENTVSVDEELSKRIEATIIKPNEISVDDFVGEKDLPFMSASEPISPNRPIWTLPTPEERRELLEAPPKEVSRPEPDHVPEPVSESEPPTAKAEAESAEVAEFVESMIEEVGVGAIKEPEEPVPLEVPEEIAPDVPEVPTAISKDEKVVEKEAIPEATAAGPDLRTAAVPAAVLASGAAAYVGILLFSVLQPVSWTIGWTVSIAGAILVTIGCGSLYDVWKHSTGPKEGPGHEAV